MATLYLVATPIGNLEDITLRALRVLREVVLVAAEDTRTARRLLSHYGIQARLVSYNEHNKEKRTPLLLAALAEGDVALVSEAGMPGISDPGVDLVRAAVAAGHRVTAVPGPSAIVAALAVSGLSTRQFTYLGFLPRRKGERQRLLASLREEPRTLVLLESPHRLRETLADLHAALGERRIAVCRELTKMFEEIFRGTVGEALAHFQEPRGEFTLVVEGAAAERQSLPPEEVALAELARLRREGRHAREAVGQVVARYRLPRRRVYQLWLQLAGERGP